MKNKLYLSLILAACTFNASATQPPQVGYIDNFDGAFTDYAIKRGDQTIPMAVYAPLYPGDFIHISENHTIDIRQCNEVRTITHQDSPYPVQSKQCNVIGLTDNIWLAIKDFVKYIVTIVPNPPYHVHTKSETESLTIPLLESTFFTIPTLKAGKRALALQWFGGQSPYQIQITTADKKVLWQTETKAQSVTTEQIDLQAGQTYWLIITAANYTKHPTELEFEVVTKLPDYPAPLQEQALPENMRRTLQAAWLVKQNSIKWSFEAYQQAADLAENYGPARELQKALGRSR
jgi:hypothetical protein